MYGGQIFVCFNDLEDVFSELCCLFGIFYCLDLNHLLTKGVLLIYLCIMAIFGDG